MPKRRETWEGKERGKENRCEGKYYFGREGAGGGDLIRLLTL